MVAQESYNLHRHNITNIPTVDFLPTPSSVMAKQVANCLSNAIYCVRSNISKMVKIETWFQRVHQQ